jgi:hypothetical protein
MASASQPANRQLRYSASLFLKTRRNKAIPIAVDTKMSATSN